MNEQALIRLIRGRYCADSGNGPAAVCLPQVRNRAGFDATRTVDALVMQLWPSRGLAIEGFEIKCSRADWLRELKNPAKAEPIAKYCDRWWIVTSTPDLILAGELPDGWGHLTSDSASTPLKIVKQAPKLKGVQSIPKSFLASILRQYDREAFAPSAAELDAEFRRGHEVGVGTAGSNATLYKQQLEDMNSRIRQFQEATGFSIYAPQKAADVKRLAAALRDMPGVTATLAEGRAVIDQILDAIGAPG